MHPLRLPLWQVHWAPHPRVCSRPTAIWRGHGRRSNDPLLFPYRPDWFAQQPNAKILEPATRLLAFQHPACAVAALLRDYSTLAPHLEDALVGSGEATYHLLGGAAAQGIKLNRHPSHYRQTLRRDGYWGLRHAARSNDSELAREVEAWAADHRTSTAGAAALFLSCRPREPLAPYRDLLHSNPFYLYVSLPQLAHRGLTVGLSDAREPKWAFHFATSTFTREMGAFEPQTWLDPGWATELLWVRSRGAVAPTEAKALAQRLRGTCPEHPAFVPANEYLRTLFDAGPDIPAPLQEGRFVEAKILATLQREKNHDVWRPTAAQIASDDFQRIVGAPQYTELGLARGTIVDAIGDDLAEIKSGGSALRPSYQLRLQAFRARIEGRKLRLYTSRLVTERLAGWLTPLGVEIDPLP